MATRDFVGTGSEAARIHAEMAKACDGLGLPWNEIFGSLGDERSPLREAALATWSEVAYTRTVVLVVGECRYEAIMPKLHITFNQGKKWAEATGLKVLSLTDIGDAPGLNAQLRMDCPDEWRLVDFTYEQEGKYHVQQVDKPSRHVQTDEYFGPNDVFIVKIDPEDSPLTYVCLTNTKFLVFEVIKEMRIGDLDKELRRYGCVLTSESEILPLFLPRSMKVTARADLMFGKYGHMDGRGDRTGWTDSEDARLLPGMVVLGKRYPAVA